jgi:peptidyl-prolyl cis-trans isomerase C
MLGNTLLNQSIARGLCTTFLLSALPVLAPAEPTSPTPVAYSLVETPEPPAQLTSADVATELRAMPESVRTQTEADPGRLTQVINDLYRRKVLTAAAVEMGLEETARVQAQLAREREEILVKAVIEAKRAEAIANLPDMAARAEEQYRAHPERYQVPEHLEARHILLRADGDAAKEARRDEAEALLARLQAGEDFAALATEVSEDPGSAKNGGLLPQFGRGQMVPEFEEAAFALSEPGARSPVVGSQFGLHIIRLERREPARQQPFEEVKEMITSRLAADWVGEAVETWRKDVIDPARATVNHDALRAFVEEVTGQSLPPVDTPPATNGSDSAAQ